MQIPNWLLKTKEISSTNCQNIYKDTLNNKLGVQKFLCFEDFKKDMIKFKIKSEPHYRDFREKNGKINWPSSISYYKITWTKFFGKNKLSLNDLKKDLKKFKINSQPQYKKFKIKHSKNNWPGDPNKHYKINWSELFEKTKLSLKELRTELKKLKIKSMPHYNLYRKKYAKKNWPSDPICYGIKWSDLFENKKILLPIEKLIKEVKKFNIESSPEYLKYRKKHKKNSWPSNPNVTYNIKWKVLFGKKEFLSISVLRKELKKLAINSIIKYKKYRKKHNRSDWPSNPNKTYNIKWIELWS